MVDEVASYEHDLGDGFVLNAYAIDPELSSEAVQEFVSSKDGTGGQDLEAIAAEMPLAATLGSIDDLEVIALDEQYQVPGIFLPYRKALEEKLLAEDKTNGPIMVIKGDVQNPLTIMRGGYFDFQATKPDAVPNDVNRAHYPPNVTIQQWCEKSNVELNQLARYLGFAFIMLPSNGEELSFVQRAKNLGVAADCMAVSGGTPRFQEEFFDPGFNFSEYFRNEVADEMKEEYQLMPNEFHLETCRLINDTTSSPFLGIEIVTPVTTQELALRTHGSPAVKEHPILYSIKPEAISALTDRFEMFPSTTFMFNLIGE